MQYTQEHLKLAIVSNPLTIKPDATIADAIALMSGIRTACPIEKDIDDKYSDIHLGARASCILVVEDEQIIGILTERDIVRLSAEQQNLTSLPIQAAMSSPASVLRRSDFTDFFVALQTLQQHHIRHLPLVDDQNKLIGLLTHESLQQISQPFDLLRLRQVKEVMTCQVVCATAKDSLLSIARQMTNKRVSAVVIVEEQDNMESSPLRIPLGIITERDIVQFQALRLNIEDLTAESVMSSPVFTIGEDESLAAVQQLMQTRLIRRMIVVGDQKELIGIVTQSSILQAMSPLELYSLASVLEEKVVKLEAEKITLLENRATELEALVKLREETLNLREDMSNMIIHDLRNPLLTILLSAEIIQKYHDRDIAKPILLKQVNRILASGKQLANMIDNLLLMAKLESGKILFNLIQTDLHELGREILTDFELIATSKTIRIKSQLPNQSNNVLIDPIILRRVIDNLLSNALKFAPRNSEIFLSMEYLPQEHFRITVADNGPGVSPEQKEKIFEKFEIGTIKQNVSQIGLGLAFCKMAVEAQGGTLQIASNQPHGAIFIVEI